MGVDLRGENEYYQLAVWLFIDGVCHDRSARLAGQGQAKPQGLTLGKGDPMNIKRFAGVVLSLTLCVGAARASEVPAAGFADRSRTPEESAARPPNLPGLSLLRIDAPRAYPWSVKRYARTLALNTVDLQHPYVIDLFLVDGGKIHDYFMRGGDRRAQLPPLTP